MSNIGVFFPQAEFGSDAGAIRDYAQAAEDLGFTHIAAYEHVLGANPDRPGGWHGPFTYEASFHEPFVLYSFMAAVTRTLGFVTRILILPQRQTALVAKQAATLDVLSGGRFRLGVGLGWNEVEYVSLGEDFHSRGCRIEEQIALLRQLWARPLVTFSGRWHTIPDAGLNPLPVQRPIPIWMGGHADAVLRRVARMADGWMPNYGSAAEAEPSLEKLDQYLAEAGRTRDSLGIEVSLPYGDGRPDVWTTLIRDWRAVGATHFTLDTMDRGFSTPQAHLVALRTFAEAILQEQDRA